MRRRLSADRHKLSLYLPGICGKAWGSLDLAQLGLAPEHSQDEVLHPAQCHNPAAGHTTEARVPQR